MTRPYSLPLKSSFSIPSRYPSCKAQTHAHRHQSQQFPSASSRLTSARERRNSLLELSAVPHRLHIRTQISETTTAYDASSQTADTHQQNDSTAETLRSRTVNRVRASVGRPPFMQKLASRCGHFGTTHSNQARQARHRNDARGPAVVEEEPMPAMPLSCYAGGSNRISHVRMHVIAS